MAGTANTVPAAGAAVRRLAAQLLSGPRAADAVAVVQRLLAVQGQDPRGARLAVRARSRGLTAASVDRALTADRSVLITWLNRQTLHLVASEDYWWLHPLTARPGHESVCLRNLAMLGVSADAADDAVAAAACALAADGPLTLAQLAGRLSARGRPASGGVPLWVVRLASQRGLVVRGPVAGGQHAYVHVRDWLGEPPPAPAPDAALGRLARRYLAGHGPAADRDLARWAGIPLGWARAGLAAIGGSLAARPDGLAELAAVAGATDEPPPVLLGPFDPLLMGWVSREPVLGSHQEAVVTTNGIFRPVALVAGQAAGTWAWQDGAVVLQPFGTLPAGVTAALAADARDVRRFLSAEPGSAGPADTTVAADDTVAADNTVPADRPRKGPGD